MAGENLGGNRGKEKDKVENAPSEQLNTGGKTFEGKGHPKTGPEKVRKGDRWREKGTRGVGLR